MNGSDGTRFHPPAPHAPCTPRTPAAGRPCSGLDTVLPDIPPDGCRATTTSVTASAPLNNAAQKYCTAPRAHLRCCDASLTAAPSRSLLWIVSVNLFHMLSIRFYGPTHKTHTCTFFGRMVARLPYAHTTRTHYTPTHRCAHRTRTHTLPHCIRVSSRCYLPAAYHRAAWRASRPCLPNARACWRAARRPLCAYRGRHGCNVCALATPARIQRSRDMGSVVSSYGRARLTCW